MKAALFAVNAFKHRVIIGTLLLMNENATVVVFLKNWGNSVYEFMQVGSGGDRVDRHSHHHHLSKVNS